MIRATALFLALILSNDPVSAQSWEDTVRNGLKWSSEENGGNPDLRRSCNPQTRTCATAVIYHNKNDGSIIMLKTTFDLSDKPISHETCIFNKTNDIETCVNNDNYLAARFMKDQQGHWVQVQ